MFFKLYVHEEIATNKRFYTWLDREYRDFMMQLLMMLEPREEAKGTIFLEELEEINELIFVNTGKVGVGYEINKQKFVCLQFDQAYIIGTYGIAYNFRAQFTYSAISNCKGYSIRKEKWHTLMEDNPQVKVSFLKACLPRYYNEIWFKVNRHKKHTMQKFMERCDHQQVFVSELKHGVNAVNVQVIMDMTEAMLDTDCFGVDLLQDSNHVHNAID